MKACSFCNNFLLENGLCPQCGKTPLKGETNIDVEVSSQGVIKTQDEKIRKSQKAQREGFEAFQVGMS